MTNFKYEQSIAFKNVHIHTHIHIYFWNMYIFPIWCPCYQQSLAVDFFCFFASVLFCYYNSIKHYCLCKWSLYKHCLQANWRTDVRPDGGAEIFPICKYRLKITPVRDGRRRTDCSQHMSHLLVGVIVVHAHSKTHCLGMRFFFFLKIGNNISVQVIR